MDCESRMRVMPTLSSPIANSFGACLLFALVAGCGGGGGSRPPSNGDGDPFADAQDCAPSDASRWQSLSFQSLDADADDHRTNSAGQLCAGASLPATHSATAVAANEVD